MTSTTGSYDTDHPGDWRHRKLTRSEDRRIGGVASGLANYFGVDPTLVRLVFVVSMLITLGATLLAYLVLWVVLPKARGNSVVRGDGNDQSVFKVIVGLVVVLLLAGTIDELRFGFADGEFVLPILLIGAGVALLGWRSGKSHPDASAGTHVEGADVPGMTPNTDPAPESAGIDPLAAPVDPPPPVPGSPYEDADEVPAREPKTPNLVTPVVLSLMMIAAGIGLALEITDAINVQLTTITAVWLLLIAAGLILSAVRGRAPGLIALGILVTFGLMIATVVDPIIDDGSGERIHTVTSLDELLDSYKLGAGELTVDLSALELNGETRTVDIELGVGHLIVLLPSEPGLDLFVSTSVGEAVFYDQLADRTERNSGLGNELTIVDADAGNDVDGLLIVNVDQLMGETEVTRVR